ncbi:MAG TPA: nucleotidyltransferase domain-containing protein [Tepidisphaeraceae bacterium]|jgi:hypothetical protein|nr:nucleotidyltransferase domain-containing protein [Tepidisphaeraceae bacterium]
MDQLIEQNRSAILRIAAAHGAGNVRVFGSMARGEARPDSDVDFLIDIVGPLTPWFPGGLMSDLENLLGRRIDVATEGELDELIRDDALKEAVSL